MRSTLTAVVIALVLIAAACGEGDRDGVGGDEPAADLWGREFVSVASEAGGRELVAGTRISLRFDESGGLGAHAGCNTMGSDDVDLDGGRLRVGSMMTTDMGCDPPSHAQDEWLSTFLASEPSWSLEGDTLLLESGDTRIELHDRRVVEPDQPLEGTRWLVVGRIDGDSASTVPGEAHLTIGDGRVTGHGGCNDFGADVEVGDGVVTFGQIESTARGCEPDLEALELHVFAVLEGEVGYRIESDSLTLTHPDGRALMLTAETD
jgi:heat shock protein HslJ